MANINVTRNTTDTQDNVRYSYNKRTGVDYKGITILIVGSLGVLTAIWLIALIAASVGCYAADKQTCAESTIVFWSYLAILVIALFVGIFFSIPTLRTMVENMRFLEWRGVITDREDLRRYATNIIEVAHESAHSEATAGMDNYSPSITNTSASATPTPSMPEVDLQPFTIDVLGGDIS